MFATGHMELLKETVMLFFMTLNKLAMYYHKLYTLVDEIQHR